MGWEPIYDTWCVNFREQERDKVKDVVPNHIVNLLERFKNMYTENLPMVRKHCKENISTVDVNLVQSGINLIEVLFE